MRSVTIGRGKGSPRPATMDPEPQAPSPQPGHIGGKRPVLVSCRHPRVESRSMFTSGGGGFPLPRIDEPFELLMVLLIFAALIWLVSRIFST